MTPTENRDQMTPIESREVRGLTTKQLLYLVMSTITIVAAVVFGYTKIVYSIEKQGQTSESLQIQFETIKIEQKTANANQQTLDIRLARIEEQLTELRKH